MVASATVNGQTYIIPGSYVKESIVPAVPGLTPEGFIGIIGESTGGTQTAANPAGIVPYATTQFALFQQNYGSGPLVDAFMQLAAPSNSPLIVGAPALIYPYKTNHTTSASVGVFTNSSSYGNLFASTQGSYGNTLNVTLETYQAAVQPKLGPFTYIPGGASVSAVVRLSGGSALNFQLGSNTSPTTTVGAFNTSTSAFLASGGVNRLSFSGNAGVTLTVTAASGNVVTFTLPTTNTFAVTPQVGDTVIVPATGNFGATANSTFSGSAGANLGAYVVTAVQNNSTTAQITTVKLSNSSTTVGVITPVNTSTTFSTVPNNDLQVYSPLQLIYKVGVNRSAFTAAASTNVSATATGTSLRVNFLGASFAFGTAGNRPQVGDDLYIPSGSVLAGAANANVGWYSVSSVNSVTGSSYVIASALAASAAPVNVSSTTLTASPDADLVDNRPWSTKFVAGISLSDGGAAQNVNAALFNLGTTTSATFISTATVPEYVAGTEFEESVETKQASTSVDEVIPGIGGTVGLEVGYLGTTGSVNVSSTSLTFTVTGGAGANFSVSTSQFGTVGDLVAYINTQPGFAATAPNNIQALQLLYTPANGVTACILDTGTYGICSSVAATEYPGQVKIGAYQFANALATSAYLAFVPTTAAAGLPDLSGPSFLSGGSQGATSGADVLTGIDAFAATPINFLVPCFSQDASVDAAQGVTAVGSTYQIDAINAAAKAHVLAMSTPVNQRNRLAVVSKRAPFAQVITAAGQMSSDRVSFAFQDSMNLNSLGNIVEFQPWMLAATAAGMQLVGQQEAITGKAPNVSGVLDYYGSSDFNAADPAFVTQALNAGLLVVAPTPQGGIKWVSDATTYNATADEIPNSLSAMYLGDLITLDLVASGTSYVVGRPQAVMTVSKVTSFLQEKLLQYLNAGWTAPSSGAPAGYQNLVVSLQNGSYQYNVNVYLDGEVLFLIGNLALSVPSF